MTATEKGGELIFSKGSWKIYKQDAGMGETDYCILHNDVFFAWTDLRSNATIIILAVNQFLQEKVQAQ